MIDLHAHSSASDGSSTPADLVGEAAQLGLRAVALTDHDTVDGIGDALTAAKIAGIELVTGIELSAEFSRGTLHIVGLHVDQNTSELAETTEWLLLVRNQRNQQIAQKLNELGLKIDLDEVAGETTGRVVGRPHFAAVLVRKGHARSESAVYRNLLGRGKAAYVSKQRLAPRRAIEVIRSAGGVPVLAHPDQTKLNLHQLDRFLEELVSFGLAGIEVFCSGYTAAQTSAYRRLAMKHKLVLSGGSDYHGTPKPGIALGRGPGSLVVQDELLAPLEEAARSIRLCRAPNREGA